MAASLTVVSSVEIGIGVVCLLIAALAWGYRRQPAGTPLVLLSLSAAGWAITAGIASLVVDPTLTKWAQYATYAFVGPAAVCWFYVVVEYAGRTWWTQRRVLLAVLATVGLQWLLIVTDPLHHLYIAAASRVDAAGVFDPTPGPLFFLTTLVNTGFILGGISLLGHTYTSRQGLLRFQTVAVLVAGIVSLLAGVIELFDLVSIRGLDLSTVGLAVGAGLILWALFAASFLTVVPIGRETLLEQISDAVVAIDTADRVVDLNPAAKALFGIDSDVIGAPSARIFEGTSLSTASLAIDAVPAEMTATVDGDPREYDVSVSPITGSSGRVDGAIGSLLLFRDVTDAKRREEELERKNARLEAFSSIVSHDLRNPLNVAQGRMDLAREEHDSHHFSAMARSLDRMETLIEDLLVLARKGKVVTDTESVDLAVLAGRCWETVATGEATLVVQTDRTLSADPNRLQELLENLFRNSVEHGSTGSRAVPNDSVEHDDPAIRITVGDLDDGSGFYVADDGCGIPPAERERVFESGYSNSDAGTGLGLAIVSEIATAHGWQVRLAEPDGGGTRFEFSVDS